MSFVYQPLPGHARRAFIGALHDWSGKPRHTFSVSFPPCNEIDGADGENAVLAQVFSLVASEYPHHEATRALAVLHAAIDKHLRLLGLLWNDAKSSRPGEPTQRTTWVEVRRYERMISTLCMWHDAIFDDFIRAVTAPGEVEPLPLDLEHA